MKLTKSKLKRIIQEELSTLLNEAGMPSSVIKHKQKLADMTDKELADSHLGDKSEEKLRQMAWRHGYGKMSDHYVKRVKRGKKKDLEEKKDDLWIQSAEKDIEKRGTEGVCTGDKFGGPTCRPGTKRYNLAKTFRNMAKKRKK